MPDEDRGVSAAEELYADLIAPIEGRMITTVARIMRDPDDAADVFQEAQAVIWRRLAAIHRHPNPQAYLLRICLSRARDALRRKVRRGREVSLDRVEEVSNPAPDSSSTRAETAAAIRAAVASLPPKQAEVVLLRALDDASYEEVAAIISCSPATARSHFSKGLARLRLILTRRGFRGEGPTPSGE